VVAGVAIWSIPAPPGLAPKAWSYFALFVTVILALITEQIPGPVIGIIGVTAATALLLVAPTPAEAARWALSGFSHGTVWLIFVAFTFGLGYEKTGLGRRIALGLVRWLRGRSQTGYAVALADLLPGALLRPARLTAAHLSMPGIPRCIPSRQHRQPISAYLMWTAFAASASPARCS
jgi:L-tartrate/succinate antiporter